VATAMIGGSGVYHPEINTVEMEVDTPYGTAVVYQLERPEGFQPVYFIPRHGPGHQWPPHLIPYRKNLYALKKLNVNAILASGAVGSMNPSIRPGDSVLIKDFIDMTRRREVTFYDGSSEDFPGVAHADMTEPYCLTLHQLAKDKNVGKNRWAHTEAVYVCTEGPRFETAAEIRWMRQMGGDVVGMTTVPEVVLAKELGICYMLVGIVTNWCTGIQADGIHPDDLLRLLEKKKTDMVSFFLDFIQQPIPENCRCQNALIRL